MVTISDFVTSACKKESKPIDNLIFRLHYKATVRALIFFSALVVFLQWIRTPITCNEGNMMPTYCYFYGIYTKDSGLFKLDRNAEKKYSTYSAWVFFVLFFQAFPFYVPHFLWRYLEGKKQEYLLLQQSQTKMSRRTSQSGLPGMLAGSKFLIYLYEFVHGWGWYAFEFFFFEVLNLVNVILQILFVDRFLNGNFLDYGLRFVDYIYSQNTTGTENPIYRVFPILTICEYNLMGRSGDLQLHQVLCSLQINPYIAWIYVFLWFWFVILAILSAIVLLYRLFLIHPQFRLWIIIWLNPKVDPSKLKSILDAGNLGDWLQLNRLCKNIDQDQFNNLIDLLYNQILGVYFEIQDDSPKRPKSQ